MGLCGGLACGVTVCGGVWQSGDTAGRKRRWHQQLTGRREGEDWSAARDLRSVIAEYDGGLTPWDAPNQISFSPA
jgi:hypothetical protein